MSLMCKMAIAVLASLSLLLLLQQMASKRYSSMSEFIRTFNRTSSPSSSPKSFGHAFTMSLTVIILSELGDKTFFIAAIMAMRARRDLVYVGAMAALVTMTILSTALGTVVTTLIPRRLTYLASTFLFLVFGLKMIYEAYTMKATGEEANDDIEEVQQELTGKRFGEYREVGSLERGGRLERRKMQILALLSQAFVLTFLAEWGDRSQITTIVLAASENVVGVCLGGCLGHAFCTGIAVLGGKVLAYKISVRTVTLCGGLVFVAFAISSFVFEHSIELSMDWVRPKPTLTSSTV